MSSPRPSPAGAADPGSYRDPDSSIFYSDGRVWRGLSATGLEDWNRLSKTGFHDRLVKEGKLVETWDTAQPTKGHYASPRGKRWAAVVEHRPIPFVSYPYEWSFSMLRDAALCQLDVLLAALDEDMTLKDGTAFNVTFTGCQPSFIDIGSFEEASGPWPGYRQFCQTMLFPLMIQAHLGIAFQPLLRGSLDGLSPTDVSAMFGGRRRFKPGVLTNVTLHALADRKVTSDSQQMNARFESAGLGANLASATARKLHKIVSDLSLDVDTSTWVDYRNTCSYTSADAEAKRRFVAAVAQDHAGGTIVDLGANDGAFSRLVAEQAGYVIAVDFDHLTIDRLYQELRTEGIDNVLPLVMDLVDASPGLGWRGRERASFEARTNADLVLSLALVHHLAISANVPLPMLIDWLADFGAETVVEFVHRDDPMTIKLLAQKPAGLFDDYNLENFTRLLGERFDIVATESLPGNTRTLFHARPRT